MAYSMNAAASNNASTIPISIAVGRSISLRFPLLTMVLMRRKLLDIPMEYAISSITPKGERYIIASGGSFASAGVVDTSALKAIPVDHAANDPHATPKPGKNMGNATDALWVKIPIASIPCTVFSKSLTNDLESSSDKLLSLPIEYATENIAIKIRKTRIRLFTNNEFVLRSYLRVESSNRFN